MDPNQHFIVKADGKGLGKNMQPPVSGVLKDAKTAAEYCFGGPTGAGSMDDMAALLNAANGSVICQTLYPVTALADFHGLAIDVDRIIDLHALAKNMLPGRPHGLDQWAARMKVQRKRFLGADQWSPEAEQHALLDARILHRVFWYLMELEAKGDKARAA